MSRYRLTSKGKRTITALFLMLSSGIVLAVIFKKGLIYGLIGIFTASAIGFLFEIYLGFKSMIRRKDLKDRMQQTLDRDYSKEQIIEIEKNKNEDSNETERLQKDQPIEENIKEETEDIEPERADEPSLVKKEIISEPVSREDGDENEADQELQEVDKEADQESVELMAEERVEEPQMDSYPVFRPFATTIDKALKEYDSKPKEEPISEVEDFIEKETPIEKPIVTMKQESVKYKKLSEFVRKIERPTFDWLHDLQIENEQTERLYLDYLIITEKGLFVIHDMEDYQVISGNIEAKHWTCFRSNLDYQNRKSTSIENPVKGLESAVESVKQILFEFDLLLPVYGLFITQDLCQLHVSDQGALKAVKLNSLSSYIENKNGIPDITEEMIGILKEIFVIKDEISREGSIS